MNQAIKEKSSTCSYDFSECPTCNGTGKIIVKRDSEGYEFAEPCPTCNGGLAEKVEAAKKNSNIPMIYYDKPYSYFNWSIYRDKEGIYINMDSKRRIIEAFLKNYKIWKQKGMGLYIFSKTKGSGKTLLASCLCNELMELYGIKTKFVNATKLLEISKSGDKESYDEYKREPIKLLCNCELLVLDDIGQKRTAYEWMNDIVYRIVDDRMTKKLVTIFTSNLSLDDLPLDDRITERINKISYAIGLPEYNVRSREAYDDKIQFLRDQDLLPPDIS